MLALVVHVVAVLSVCFGQLGAPAWTSAHGSKPSVVATHRAHAQAVVRRAGKAHVVVAHPRGASPALAPSHALAIAAAGSSRLPAPVAVARGFSPISEVAHFARGPPAEG